MTLTMKSILILVAVVLFTLVGFKANPEALHSIDLLGFGLAFFAAAFLVP